MPNQKRRTAWSVQDVVSGRAGEAEAKQSPRFKSGYSGPKKQTSSVRTRMNAQEERRTGVIPVEEIEARSSRPSGPRYQVPNGQRNKASAPYAMQGGNGIFDFAWIVYCAILGICLLISIITFSVKAGKVDGYRYPSYMLTVNGVLDTIFKDYKNGGLGSSYNPGQAEKDAAEAVDEAGLLGENNVSSELPNTTTGATMTLDTGSTYGDYQVAASYDELITQIEKALSSNDFGFIGMKLAYEDSATGTLIGYPQSVVEHFTAYMSENTSKREVFMSIIKDEATYMARNGSAYLVKIPMLMFTVNMGYDGTTVSISGFADQTMNAGQSAVVSPLLPCMYTITVTTKDGSQSSEVECDMSEGNLQINIGVTN